VHNSEQAAAPRVGDSHREALLAAHLTALRVATEELARTTGRGDFAEAAERLAERIAQLAPAAPAASPRPHATDLLAHTHDLAARALVVAAAQQDTRSAVLACQVMDATAL
jgi:hypothetical protein